LAFSWIRLNLGFLLRENLLLYSSYLPLGVPNWTVKNYPQCAASKTTGFPGLKGKESCKKWQRSFFYVKNLKKGADYINLPPFDASGPGE
jgi:hypothetical protein